MRHRYLKEGHVYPELRHCRVEDRTLELWDPPVFSQIDPYSSVSSMQKRTVPGVRVELPTEDWNNILEILRDHYHPASRNPAVMEAWQHYRMLVRLTQSYE